MLNHPSASLHHLTGVDYVTFKPTGTSMYLSPSFLFSPSLSLLSVPLVLYTLTDGEMNTDPKWISTVNKNLTNGSDRSVL